MSLTADPTSIMYLQLPDVTPRRVLHGCQVREVGPEVTTLESTEQLAGIEANVTVLVYFEDRQTFMQQPARVCSVTPMEDETGQVIELELLGKPVNAEQRQVYRVSCIAVAITATMNNEPDCQVVDISASGFGVNCKSHFHIGAAVTARIHWDGETFVGPVVVVSVREVGDGYRYGVRCVDSVDGRGTTLRRSLTRISLAVQREQMRRVQ